MTAITVSPQKNDYLIHGFDTSKLPEEGQIALAVKVYQTKTDSEWKVESIEEMKLTKNQYLGIASKTTHSFFKGINSTQTVLNILFEGFHLEEIDQLGRSTTSLVFKRNINIRLSLYST